jgi:hypothetical protein
MICVYRGRFAAKDGTGFSIHILSIGAFNSAVNRLVSIVLPSLLFNLALFLHIYVQGGCPIIISHPSFK